MKFLRIFAFLFAFLFPRATGSLEKRATQVSLINYTFTNNVLAGSIKIQNIAFSKTVVVYYATGNTWDNNRRISAAYSSGPGSDGYETWVFSGAASGATQFYIKYDVSGVSYYDPGNSVNYQITPSTTIPPVTTPTSQCTVTRTTTIRRS